MEKSGFPPDGAVGCHTVSLGCFPSWSQFVVYSSSQNAVLQKHLSAETAWAGGLVCCCHFAHIVWVDLLSGLFLLRAFIPFGCWKLAPLHTRGTGRELVELCSGNGCLLDYSWSKVRLAAPSKLSWSQVTVCSLFVPHSSSGSIPESFSCCHATVMLFFPLASNVSGKTTSTS